MILLGAASGSPMKKHVKRPRGQSTFSLNPLDQPNLHRDFSRAGVGVPHRARKLDFTAPVGGLFGKGRQLAGWDTSPSSPPLRAGPARAWAMSRICSRFVMAFWRDFRRAEYRGNSAESQENYKSGMATDAWKKTLAFFKANLR